MCGENTSLEGYFFIKNFFFQSFLKQKIIWKGKICIFHHNREILSDFMVLLYLFFPTKNKVNYIQRDLKKEGSNIGILLPIISYTHKILAPKFLKYVFSSLNIQLIGMLSKILVNLLSWYLPCVHNIIKSDKRRKEVWQYLSCCFC